MNRKFLVLTAVFASTGLGSVAVRVEGQEIGALTIVNNHPEETLLPKRGQTTDYPSNAREQRLEYSYLGVQVVNLTDVLRRLRRSVPLAGALVTDVEPASPADQARLHPGCVIVAVDDVHVFDTGDLERLIQQIEPGDDVPISFYAGDVLYRKLVRLVPASKTYFPKVHRKEIESTDRSQPLRPKSVQSAD